jgi:Zn-dependent protease
MPELAAAIQRIAVFIVPFLLAIICHEVAHGYVALWQGDPTAKRAGRLTLNPIPHIDPTGALVFVMLAMFSPVVIGWAKPVPVNPINFRNTKRGMILVSLAGAGANFLLAIVFAALFKHGLQMGWVEQGTWLFQVLRAGLLLNLLLGLFNLLPIPPLDGSKVLAALLPPGLAMKYLSIQRYGLIIVVLLLLLGLLDFLWLLILDLAGLLLQVL